MAFTPGALLFRPDAAKGRAGRRRLPLVRCHSHSHCSTCIRAGERAQAMPDARRWMCLMDDGLSEPLTIAIARHESRSLSGAVE